MGEEYISNDIRKLRFEHGEMTQQQLADAVGCTRQTIILLEQQRYSPSLMLAYRIARVFGKTIEELFHFSEDAPGAGDPRENS